MHVCSTPTGVPPVSCSMLKYLCIILSAGHWNPTCLGVHCACSKFAISNWDPKLLLACRWSSTLNHLASHSSSFHKELQVMEGWTELGYWLFILLKMAACQTAMFSSVLLQAVLLVLAVALLWPERKEVSYHDDNDDDNQSCTFVWDVFHSWELCCTCHIIVEKARLSI